MRLRPRTAGALLVAAASLSWAARSVACGPCGSGDTTLTSAGTEQPFLGRLRSAAALRYRTDAIGVPGLDRARIRELRADVSTAWAVRDDLFLLASLPVLYRDVTEESLARNELRSIGDVELGAKWFVWRDRSFAPRWLVATLGGVKLPTAPWREGAPERPLPLEAQPGSGSLDLSFGASLAFFSDALSSYVSLQLREPMVARSELEPGRSLHASAALQYQLGEPVALRGLCELRLDQSSRERGERDPHSGGAIAYLGAELLLSPFSDFSLAPGARLPALQRLRGSHEEGPIFSLALIRDW
ncbi:MAG: hypothetical protein RL685_5126 [Pseudomonadota bacterium]|jgi:hypothetical protein